MLECRNNPAGAIATTGPTPGGNVLGRHDALLHVISKPRAAESNTLRVSQAFLAALKAEHPDVEIETLDLFRHDLPAVTGPERRRVRISESDPDAHS